MKYFPKQLSRLHAFGAFRIGLCASLFFGALGYANAVEIFFYQRGYVAGGSGASTTLTDAAVAAFNETHPDIEIRVMGLPWSREGDLKLRAALLNRRKVDVFRLAHDQVRDYIPAEGALLSPIDPYLSDADLADISPGALDALRYNGQVMAWPLWSVAFGFIGNTDIIEERGIEIPTRGESWTWEEMVVALKQGTFTNKAGDSVYGMTVAARPPLFEWSPLLWAEAGPIFLEANGEGSVGRGGEQLRFAPGVAAALGRIAQLKTMGVVPPSFGIDDQPAAQNQFLSGRATFLMSSPGFIRTLAAKEFPYVILPPPVGSYGKAITTGAMGCFAVVDQPRAPERTRAAHEFAKYLTSAEIAEAVPGWYLAPPVRGSVTRFRDDPTYAGLAEIVQTSVYMNPPGGPGFVQRTLIPQFQAAIIGATPPEDALEAILAAYDRQALR